MKCKQVLVMVVAFCLMIPLHLIQPNQVFARDWALQISDSKDSGKDIDIKSVYARDDNDYLYFKVESHVNWNLSDNNGTLGIYIDLNGQKEPDFEKMWVLAVMELDGSYEGMALDLSNENMESVDVNFKSNSKIGTFKVEKKAIGLKTTKFSISCVILELGTRGNPMDIAPDDFNFVVYKPGGAGKGAKLSVSTGSLDLGVIKSEDTASGSFEINNEGEGNIEATLKSSTNISLSSEEVTIEDYGSETIIVDINAERLTPKIYSEPIEIQSKFGNETVMVNFEILPKPVLNVDMELIDFGTVIKGEKKSEKIRISNKVKGPIKGSLSSTNKAFLLSKTSFDSISEEVTVSLSTKSLEVGTVEGKIKIISNGGSISINVQAELINSMTIDKTMFDFGEIDIDDPKLEPMLFTVKNQTDEAMTLKILCKEDWISIGSEIKMQPNETKELKIGIKLDKMETINQDYLGEITFESKYEKQVIPVKARIKQELPKTLWLTDPPDQKEVNEKIITGKIWDKIITIKNGGSGVMNVSGSFENNKSDFRVFNAKFSLKKGESREIKIKFDSTSMKLETYKNTLNIESNGGNLSIPISIEVQPKPEVMIKLFIGLSIAYIGQDQIKLDSPPYIKKGTTMVPLRFITEAFKAKLEWQTIGKGRIILTVPSKTIQLDIGEPHAFINNEKIMLQTPAEIKAGRTFVPLRFIAEGLGAIITWKADTQQITILYVIEE